MAELKSRIARPVRGADLRSLPLSPMEGFVLSRVDGSASVGEISDLTGLPTDAVIATLEKLVRLDAIEWAEGATGLPRPSVRPGYSSAPPASEGPRQPTPPRSSPRPAMRIFAPPATRPELQVGTAISDLSSTTAPTPSITSRPPSDPPSDMPLPDIDGEPTRPMALPPPPPSAPATRERTGVHVYSAKHQSEPPIVETVERPPSAPPRSPVPAARGSTRPMGAEVPPERTLSRPPAPPPSPRPAASPVPPARASSATPPVASSATGSPPAATSTSSPAASKPPATTEIDLPEDKRKRIDELYVVVDLLDHYQVLGIERTVDRARVKSAYFELSKQFHPDTAFRKNVGPYRHKMEVIFKRLTEAYEVLSKKKPREEYDEYLARSEKSQELEQTLSGQHDLEKALAAIEAEEARKREAAAAQRAAEQAARAAEAERVARERAIEQQRDAERKRAEEQRRQREEGIGSAGTPAVFSPRMGSSPGTRQSQQNVPVVRIEPPAGHAPTPRAPTSSGASSPGGVPEPSAPMSEEAKQRARELAQRRLMHPRSTAKPIAEPPPPRPAATKTEMIRDLTASLKGTAQLTGGVDPVQRHMSDAQRALANGDLLDAVRKLRLALAMAPNDPDVKAKHDAAARKLAASLADNYREQAEYEERNKKWASAALSWQKVVDGRPDEASCHWRAARALLESSGDVKAAVRLAQRAVDLDRNNVFAIRVLGRAFMLAGMGLNAKRELERAVLLDPSDEPTKALLKELKSG